MGVSVFATTEQASLSFQYTNICTDHALLHGSTKYMLHVRSFDIPDYNVTSFSG